MATKPSQSKARKPRTDAQRNRERILEVAKQAFSQSGASASLDDIAKEAGVGPGTLYRHFPTSGGSLASLDAVVRRLHRREADHRACAQCASRRSEKGVRS